VDRSRLLGLVERSLRCFPVTVLLGPLQCGKTTLARELARRDTTYFDRGSRVAVAT